ncbi:MAG: hypothetical protein M1827_002618 [Pycnora praestabilis]|nr:MAG: hypothetical protein M1827_002618 [Pycnora praestabilis]
MRSSKHRCLPVRRKEAISGEGANGGPTSPSTQTSVMAIRTVVRDGADEGDPQERPKKAIKIEGADYDPRGVNVQSLGTSKKAMTVVSMGS